MQENSYAEMLNKEEEARANLHIARAMTVAQILFAVCFLLNEVGLFEANKGAVRIAFALSVLLYLPCRLGAAKRKVLGDPRFKFCLLGLGLLLTLIMTSLLPSYTTLLFVLPPLMAAQYRSRKLAVITLVCSCLFALFSPVLAFYLKAYNIGYLTGYLETVVGYTVKITETPSFTRAESVYRILLYLGFPSMLLLLSLCGMILSIIRSRRENYLRRLEIADLNNRLTKQLRITSEVQDDALIAMAQLIESRDSSTGGHVRRTALIVQSLCKSMLRDPASGMTESLAANMVKSAPLHDLGKIAIDDAILRKPGPLTPEEWVFIKKHPTDSARSIEQVFRCMEDAELTRVAINMAFYHHERLDGSGYPKGLAGHDIPLEARIMAVADVLDAVLSRRSYKAPVPFETALSIVKEEMLSCRLDPILLPYLLEMKEEIRKHYL